MTPDPHDRIENAVASAGSLLERLEGSRAPRAGYRRELVRRLAQQLHLLEAASLEAVESGPRDAFVAVEPLHEDAPSADRARDFARSIAEMYETWARVRGMRLASIASPASDPHEGAPRVLAIAGFAAYALLAPEAGLHVLEWDAPEGRGARRVTARVRVVRQPFTPARDGRVGLRRQALEALATAAAPTNHVVRRYRESPAPLVRDAVRGWRTGRIERVLGGDFDVIPVEA